MVSSSANPKHIPSLGLLRGLAALSVCLLHVLNEGFSNHQWLKYVFSYGYLGLDLFFIISGFVIPYSMFQNNYSLDQFPKFLLKRSLRIEPPYIMSFLLIILMRIIHVVIHNWNFPSEPYYYTHDWTQFALHFLYLNQYFGYESYTLVYWTLAIEFQFYLLIGFLFPLIINSKKAISLSLLLFFCTLIWFLTLHYNWFIFQYGYLFIAGILVFLYTIRYITLTNFIILLTGLLLLIYFKNGLDVFFITIFGVFCIINIKREWRVANFFGKISYSLYLVHLEAAGWFMLYMNEVLTNNIVLRISAVLFAIAFATGFHYLFERPALRLSKSVHYQSFGTMLRGQMKRNYKKILIYLIPLLLIVLGLSFVPSPPDQVSETPRNGKTIMLKASNNKYLCVEIDSLVYANRESGSVWETFILIDLGNGRCAIKAHTGLYLCAEMDKKQEITASRKSIGSWETFTIEEITDNLFTFKGVNNKYLSVDKGSTKIFSISDSIGVDEKFRIEEK